MHGYRLGGLERIGVELASGMGVPPLVKTSTDYHKGSENVNFLEDLHCIARRFCRRLLKEPNIGVIGNHALRNTTRNDIDESFSAPVRTSGPRHRHRKLVFLSEFPYIPFPHGRSPLFSLR